MFDNREKRRGGNEDEEEEVEEERGKCFSSDERCFNFSFPQGVSAHDWRGDRERESECVWAERERGEGTESPRHLTDTETQREADLVPLKQAEMRFLVG